MFYEYFEVFQHILGINLIRYFLPAGLAFLIYYVWFRNRWQHTKIQPKFPTLNDYQREIFYSLISILIFVIIGVIVFVSPLSAYNQVYTDIAEYGWGYWTFSILLMIVVHDTYFYWTHRAMHHPRLFRYFHLTHHRSVNPSPWAAYAFHPLEGVVEAGIVVPIAFLFPIHLSALMVFLIFMIVYNVYGHLGYELFPRGFSRHPIGRWLNTSVNHNQHHKHFDGNYGLYFLFWDRVMGTLRADYDASYDAVDRKRVRKPPLRQPV